MIELKCMVRQDKQIAIFHKNNNGLKAYVVSKPTLLSILKDVQNKHNLTDPYLNSLSKATLHLGLFSINTTKLTLNKMLKMLKPYEVK